jgi:hypothetical protein
MNIKCINTYKELYDDQTPDLDLIQTMIQNTQCTVMLKGNKKAEMTYYFCSCDPNQRDAICEQCANTCHAKHNHSRAYFGPQVCTCGIKCHSVTMKRLPSDTYVPRCLFLEMSRHSGTNVYYETNNGIQICMFCRIFCFNNTNLITKRLDDTSDRNTPDECCCDKPHHSDVKFIHESISEICDENRRKVEDYCPTQIINLIFKCEKSFKNIYGSFIIFYENKLNGKADEDNLELDKKMNHSNYFWSIVSLANCASNTQLYYFSPLVKKYWSDPIIITKILKKKLEDNKVVFIFLTSMLITYHKFIISAELAKHPRMKILDVQNYSPLQRLCINSHVKENPYIKEVLRTNLIDRYLDMYENLTKLRFSHIKGFDLIIRILCTLKKFSKYYLFNPEQMVRYCLYTEEIFYTLNHKARFVNNIENTSKSNDDLKYEIREYTLKILKNITKTLVYFALHHNDKIVLMTLENQIDINGIKFVHTRNEIGKHISKNVILILNFMRNDVETNIEDDKVPMNTEQHEEDSDTKEEFLRITHIRHLAKNVMFLGYQLLNVFIGKEDYFTPGLKRCLSTNLEFYRKLINEPGLIKDKERKLLGFLKDQENQLLALYESYFNFDIKFEEMASFANKSINDLFVEVDKTGYKQPSVDLFSGSENEEVQIIQKLKNKQDRFNYNLVMTKSNYLQVICRILEFPEAKKSLSYDSIDLILKLLYYFTENEPDNCMIGLSSDILYALFEINPNYSEKILDYIINCLKTLYFYKYEFTFSKFIRKISFDIWSNTIDLDNMYPCLHRLLKIIKLQLSIPSLNKQITVNSVRKILKTEIFNNCQLITKYKQYLLNVASAYEHKQIMNDKDIFEECIRDMRPTVTLELGTKIFSKYLKLINLSFDDNAMFNDNKFLMTIMNKEELLSILKIRSLPLNLRTELVKCFRMTYVDVPINSDSLLKYRKEFCQQIEVLDDENPINDDLRIFVFLEKLMRISDEKFNIAHEYDALYNELKSFKAIIDESNIKNNAKIMAYFENAIILPLKIYLNKVFSIVSTLTGEEFLKVYELAYLFLDTKKYVLEKGIYNEEPINKIENDMERSLQTTKIRRREKSIVKRERVNEEALLEIEKDMAFITDKKFKPLDYVSVYHIISKHLLNFIEHPQSLALVHYFTHYDEFKESIFENYRNEMSSQGLLSNALEQRIFDIIVEYEKEVDDFNEYCVKLFLNDTLAEEEVNYRYLLVQFLFFLSSQTIYQDEIFNKECNEVILSLLQNETTETQAEVLKLYREKKIDLNALGEFGFMNILSIIFNEYNPSSVELSDDYYVACHIIKIFKFLCEEHNKEFQSILMTELSFKVEDEKKIMFFDLMILILDKILILSGWENVKYTSNENYSYFYALFCCIIELLIEIIQGTKTENFALLYRGQEDGQFKFDGRKTKADFDLISYYALPLFLTNITKILFNDSCSNETIINVRKEIVNFLLAFMEENSCPKEIVDLIMSSFLPQSILKSICATLKKYYLHNVLNADNKLHLEDDEDYVQKKVSRNITFLDRGLSKKKKNKSDKLYKVFKLNDKLYNYFSDLYYNDELFSETPEFELCNAFYIYFKLSIVTHNHPETVSYWNKIHNLDENTISSFNKRANKTLDNILAVNDVERNLDESDCEAYYVIKLFEQIVKSVLVKMDGIEESVMVVYTVSSLLNYLSVNSKLEFLRGVSRDSRHTKLYSLMEHSLYFKYEIGYNWRKIRNNVFFKVANKIDYFYVALFGFFGATCINIALLFIMYNAGDSYYGVNSIYFIENFSFVIVGINLFFFLIWCITKLPLYYIIENSKYSEILKLEGKHSLNILDRAIIAIKHCLFSRSEINAILWISLFMFLGAYKREYDFCYTCSLLCVVNLSKLLNNILLSVVLKGKQLMWTGGFTLIIVYIWAAWGFFYDNKRFIDVAGRHEPVNQCESLIYCYLYSITTGIRKHAGIGQWLPYRSYFINSNGYIQATFFNLVFFLLVTIIMMHIIFGIIIDTFRELRGEAFKSDFDKANICFICDAKKDALEKKGLNFYEHCEVTHDIWGYVNYMITLRIKDTQDLNMVNSYCKEKLESRSTSWLPLHKKEAE